MLISMLIEVGGLIKVMDDLASMSSRRIRNMICESSFSG